MNYRAALCAALGSVALAAAEIPIHPIQPEEAAKISYVQQIQPLLQSKCALCHSAESPASGLDVTSHQTLLRKGAKAGPGVVPGSPDSSAIVQYIRGERQPQMPKGLAPLTAGDLHLIRSWIQAGAKDDSAAAGSARAEASPAALHEPANLSPGMLEKINAALFTANAEELMILRRNLRLAQLPAAPDPPAIPNPAIANNEIDRFIAAKWGDRAVPKACDDNTFLRRVYLDIIGAIPTLEETRRFLADTSQDKRSRLIDSLLARNEEYAAHWTPFWEDALASSTTTVRGGIATHGNYSEWIYRNFVRNTPYDVMVASLIDPSMPGYKEPIIGDANGKKLKVHYILNENHTDTLLSASNVAQVFLGTSMKCASCHNHFLNSEWPQARFLAFAGMFSGNDLEVIRCERKSGQFVKAKFPFPIPGAPDATPQTEAERLHRVAQLITDPADPRFAVTVVNRLWKRYLGLGLFEPADDYRLDMAPSHPELLKWLADDFMRHGYDLKHTIRLILNSRTYQLAYNPQLEDHFDVAKPSSPRYFLSPQLRRLTAEELLDSITVAGIQRIDPYRRVYLDKSSTALTRALGRPASRNEISTGRPEDAAVVQSLELMNGNEYHDLIYSSPILSQAGQAGSREGAIEKLYWAALGRAPSKNELALGAKFLAAAEPGQSRKPASHAAPVPEEIIWLDDQPSKTAVLGGTKGAQSWRWITPAEGPVLSGGRSHTQTDSGTAHSIADNNNPLPVHPNDRLFAYVYLDPAHPPQQIRMQWQRGGQGGWAYMAQWGGPPTPGILRYDLPETGKWVRLEVPVRDLIVRTNDEGITAWSFEQTGGVVFWDKAGMRKDTPDMARENLGDVLWALVTSPEFQYIH